MYKRIYVEIGNLCNLRCSFCPPVKRAGRQMTVSEFHTICQKLKPFTNYLLLHVMGEPLLHPALDTLLSVADSYGFQVGITTNGTLLPAKGEMLLRHHPVIHRVSISLHSLEGNEASRFIMGTYLQNCISFAKQAAGNGIYTVFRLWNLDSEQKAGANRDNALIEATLQEAFPGNWDKRYSGYRIAQNIFLEYAGIFTWPGESEAEETQEGRCHGAIDQLAVLADGTVVPCCLDSEGAIPLGNLFTQSMEEIVSSPRLITMCENFRKGKFTEALCKKCTYARRF